MHQASRFLSLRYSPAKTEKIIVHRKLLKSRFAFTFQKKLAGVRGNKFITAGDVRSRRYGRDKAGETIALLSARWSKDQRSYCSVTASGGVLSYGQARKAVQR
jgi:hypothetical protein